MIHTDRERVQLGRKKLITSSYLNVLAFPGTPHSEPGIVLGDGDRDSKLKQRFLQGSCFLSQDLVLQASPHPAAKPTAEGKGEAGLS